MKEKKTVIRNYRLLVIKKELNLITKHDEKIKYLRSRIKQMRTLLKKYDETQTNKSRIQLKPLSLPKGERILYFKQLLLMQSIVFALDEIDRIKIKSKLFQIIWYGQKEQLVELTRRLSVGEIYLKNNMTESFVNLFYVRRGAKEEGRNRQLIKNEVQWEKSIKSCVYLFTTLGKSDSTRKRLLKFCNEWIWMENVFIHKGKWFSNCATAFGKLNKLRPNEKNKLDTFITAAYKAATVEVSGVKSL